MSGESADSSPAEGGPPDVRVLAVDDQKIFRDVMRAVVEATPGFALVCAAADGEEALELTDRLTPDLAIVDVRMPGMDGLELARALLRRARAPVVMLVSAQAAPVSLPLTLAGSSVVFVAKERLRPSVLLAAWANRPHAAPETDRVR